MVLRGDVGTSCWVICASLCELSFGSHHLHLTYLVTWLELTFSCILSLGEIYGSYPCIF